ncbi:hypothetical protein [Sulfurimonas sp.]|uniref:hypothetical protein n=1 Tax=Sulfurimonas sp. TaxID=2022749 RepID=UPI002606156A|nr:hypothetical protein [Sulfurimonas sp.]
MKLVYGLKFNGYILVMEKYKKVENNFLIHLENFDATSKQSAISSFAMLWYTIKDYRKHLNKRMNIEEIVIDEHDYLQKTFNALSSDETFFELYEAADLWDRVFYTKEDNWAVIVAQNGKILTSYKIDSTIVDTLSKHKEQLGAKVNRVEVSNEFRQTIKQITEKLREF